MNSSANLGASPDGSRRTSVFSGRPILAVPSSITDVVVPYEDAVWELTQSDLIYFDRREMKAYHIYGGTHKRLPGGSLTHYQNGFYEKVDFNFAIRAVVYAAMLVDASNLFSRKGNKLGNTSKNTKLLERFENEYNFSRRYPGSDQALRLALKPVITYVDDDNVELSSWSLPRARMPIKEFIDLIDAGSELLSAET